MGDVIREWLSHPPDSYTQVKNENRGYALIGANIALVLMVLICFLLKLQHTASVPIPGCSGKDQSELCRQAQLRANPPAPHFGVWVHFLVFEAVSIMTYGVNAFLPGNLGSRIISSIGGRPSDASKGLQIPLWFTVWPNAYALGYLAFETGGLSTSPYAQVLLAMLIVAQQARKDIPEREVHRGFFRTLADAARVYRPFLLVATVFYAVLLLAETIFSTPHVASAPPSLAFGFIGVLFVIATIANFVIGSTPRNRHEPLDWTHAEIENTEDGDVLKVVGAAPLPMKVSLNVQREELSDDDYRAVYVHGFLEVDRPPGQTDWEASLEQLEECRGAQGIVLVGAKMRLEFTLLSADDEA
jgi:hypothetical protein